MQIRLQQKTAMLGLTALGMMYTVVAIASTVPVYAQTPTQESAAPGDEAPVAPPTLESEPAAGADPVAPDLLESYTYADLFSVGLPTGWQATEQPASPQVILSLAGGEVAAAEIARTEITWFDQPPEVIVAQVLRDLKESGYTVSRYETQGIDGTTALNIWLADLPDGLPNAFMSYIGYADSTAGVVSYYTAPNQELEAVLGSIHESFQRLE